MKNSKINRLLSLAALAIAAILTACSSPSADSKKSGPEFRKLGIDIANKKIIVSFNTNITGRHYNSKITVKKDNTALELTTDYTPKVEKGNLVITLKTPPKTSNKYTVELRAGAVQDANGKDNTPAIETFTVGILPAIKQDSLTFRTKSSTVLNLFFNTDIEIVDPAKIRVEVRIADKEKFTAARATSKVNTKTGNLLELTLPIAATNNNVYKVKVEAGALKSTDSGLVHTKELTSNEFTYSTNLILNTTNRPFIMNNKIVVNFNLPVALKDWEKGEGLQKSRRRQRWGSSHSRKGQYYCCQQHEQETPGDITAACGRDRSLPPEAGGRGHQRRG